MKKKEEKAEQKLCLGIETTAHTFGAAVVSSSGEVLSNMVDAFKTEEGGMIPAEVAIHHTEVCGTVIKNALEKAGEKAGKEIKIDDIDIISFSQSPGMGHALRIGAVAARSLSGIYNKPLVGVNHCIAHLEIGRLRTKAKDPILLYASGANTQIIAYEGGKYRVFGETLDIGVGNMLDAFARHTGLGFPGGPKIEKLALECKNRERLVELPYCVKGMDINLGGILTNARKKFDLKDAKIPVEDIAYSLQETVFAMLIEVSERAMAHTGKTELLLGGGVACNKRLQEMARKMCESRNAECFVPENQLLIDNAAMIAWTGILMFNAGIFFKPEETDKAVKLPYLRTDQIEVKWR